ncbi:MFS transporter [Escherichia coli]|uniref:MFS transporter n=1 Tax=Escherichia coli TaxID=562 RepID=UPI001CDCADEA|nr:MFS transporter [Escherichia coli]
MSDHNPLTLKLNLWKKIAYGMDDVGSNLMLSIGTLYLLKFYTDELGMPAYYGGIIFLVAKFFTAFTDMLTGFLLDSRKILGLKANFVPLFYMQRFRRR